MRTSYAAVVQTPVGKFLLAATEKGLALVEKILFDQDPSTALEMMDRDGSNAKAMAPYIEQFNEFFAGKPFRSHMGLFIMLADHGFCVLGLAVFAT